MFGRFLTDSGRGMPDDTDYESIKCDLAPIHSEMTDRTLTHYYNILAGDERARYLRTKSRMIEVDVRADDEALKALHEFSLESSPEAGRGDVSLLDLKAELAHRMLRGCRLCERACGVDRLAGEKGHCGVLDARISSDFLHMGEEPDLVPSYTIFFSGCTFECAFCQNWDISTRPDSGVTVNPSVLARKIESKASREGRLMSLEMARNVNWVGGDPTSNLPFILDVLRECNASIPQVWNSNMYLSVDAMRLLDGVIDVYLTDFKYGNDRCALRLSNVRDYLRVVQRNHLMARENAELIIRHLVLPGHVDCCTRPALTWIADNLRDVKVNVMSQYRPEHKARQFEEISHPLGMREYQKAIDIADRLGLDLTD
jgi:putative pyruvate formate lyase activating enzyme